MSTQHSSARVVSQSLVSSHGRTHQTANASEFKRRSLRRKIALLVGPSLAALALTQFAAPSARAETYYWDSDGTTLGFGTAAGTWADPTIGSATQGWSIDPTGGAIPGDVTTLNTNATTDALNFGNGATGLATGTIAVSGSVNAGALTFASGSGAITLSGGTINLLTAGVITVNNTTNTISSEIAGTSFTKSGSGTLVLSGANSFTGAVTVSTGGALRIENDTALGTTAGGIIIPANAALQLQGGITVGAEALTIQGGGISSSGAVRNISGNNSYAGTISMTNSTRYTSDSGTLTLSGGIGSSTATARGVIVSGAGDVVLSGVLSNTVSLLNKDNVNGSGTGTLTLSGNNTYAGLTTISAGTLKLGATGSGANSPLGTITAGTVVTGTGTLDLAGFTLVTAEALSLAGTGISSSGALINSGGAATYSGLVTLTAAASIVANGNIVLSNTGTIAGSGFGLTLDGTATGSSIGSIIGTAAGTLTKTGSGTWALSRVNTYTGATNVTGGTLALTGAGAINNSSGITINGSDAKLLKTSSAAITPIVTLTQGTLTGSGTVNTVNVGAGTGGIISNNNGVAGAALTIGALTFDGEATVNTFSNSTSAAIVTTTLATNAAGTVTINPTAASWTTGLTYDLISYGGGSIGGAGFSQFALGTVTGLSARQSVSSPGNSGTAITMTVAGDFPYWVGNTDGNWNLVTANNWKLLSDNSNTTFMAGDEVIFDDSATGTTTIDINAANVTPNSVTFNNTTAFPYAIGSTGGFGITSGSLTKNNTGTVTLSSVNTYSGATTINAGTLNLTGSLAGTAITVNGTSVLTESSTGVIGGTASLTHNSSGTTILAGLNTYTGGTAITAGTLQLSGVGRPGAAGSAVAVSNGALLDLNGTNQSIAFTLGTGTGIVANNSGSGTSVLTLSATPAASSILIQDNTNSSSGKVAVVIAVNTQTLNNLNTYTGGTTVNAGAFLYLGAAAPSGAGTGPINLTAFGGTGATSSGLVVDGATYANDITGAGYVHSNGGTNTTIFTGNITTTGPFIFRSGTGDIYHFAGNGTTSSLSGVIGSTTSMVNGAVASGGIIKSGTGTLTLSGVSPYTGTTLIRDGVLSINNIQNTGTASAIGAPTTVGNGTIVMGSAATTGTLIYTGGLQSTNRRIQIGTNSTTPAATDAGGAIIQNDGTDALTFSAALFNAVTDAATGEGANRTLTLQGSNTGANTIAGTIRDNLVSGTGTGTATVAVTKAGPGTWALGGANTYTGATTVNDGTLVVTNTLGLVNNSSANILMAAPDDSFTSGAANPVLTRAIGAIANAYAGFGSKATTTEPALPDPPLTGIALQTTADILMSYGTNDPGDNLSMSWRQRTAAEADASNVNAVLSDVINITGMDNDGSDIFVLQMSYTADALSNLGLIESAIANSGELRLGYKNGPNPTDWVSATTGNTGANGSLAVGANLNFQGSWDEFVSANSGLSSGNLNDYLGSRGVDIDTKTVWAIIDHNSEFAVIPEPSTLVFGGLALLGFAGAGLRKRRMTKQVA